LRLDNLNNLTRFRNRMKDPVIAPAPGTARPDPAPCGNHAVCLGLGSNLGDREGALQSAINRLADCVTLTALSPLYASAPWGVTDQPAFLNCCLAGTTTLAPEALLATVKQIEQEIGRKPRTRWGPREIDIDILLWDDLVLESADLSLPHPHLTARNFVLVPLADIAPDRVHPVTGERIADLAARIGRYGLTQLAIDLTLP
jgi:2-amino-4-hydroxy-6-hydroxymethyldihydropteridine diphosphokinase